MCHVKQVLPLVPPGKRAEGSPYAGQDANCRNTLLISLEELVKDGLLMKHELPGPIDAERVDFSMAEKIKYPLIAKAAARLISSHGALRSQLEQFQKDPNLTITCSPGWLEDAAYFAAIDDTLNTFTWYDWPEPLKNRYLAALEEIYQSRKDFIDIFIAKQFLFQRQWHKVRKYAQMKGISIMGDMPIYVDYHSADVWANRKQFLLNGRGFPLLVSGVPPDAFSDTGQLWGSPLYDWTAMEKMKYSWWTHRMRRAQDLFDEFRIDHFRGFAGYWAVPAEAKIATVGRWKVGPGKSLFDAMFQDVGKIKIIAEDLGVITEDVVHLRKSINAPGMAVLQFGFGSDAENPHLPHNHEKNQVVYTGTHDNDTIRGWWEALPKEEKSNVRKYLGNIDESEISWEMISAALSSVAHTTIIPMQDVLGLGNSARMNIPATQFGNWSWRVPSSITFNSLNSEANRLRDLLATYGRLWS
ncbi:transferase [Lithospermum erythrorhizon]|uniref:4-alpha-glucanotransferase n=1 Tax=Lithospermum erythrorhizon TaxID=34254 RepID=A0AAV3PU50_LITER